MPFRYICSKPKVDTVTNIFQIQLWIYVFLKVIVMICNFCLIFQRKQLLLEKNQKCVVVVSKTLSSGLGFVPQKEKTEPLSVKTYFSETGEGIKL